uniref:Reverse transcriptase domain-containing protein n=1 Tax=Leptobrachium leishanense TaxID=445787 RepID=A0A8C5PEB2_9ANUR
MFAPRDLRLTSYNVRGLNTPEKRSKLFRELRSMRTSVALLQETHFRLGSTQALQHPDYPLGYFGSYSEGKSRGVAILISRLIPFEVEDTLTDPSGRYIFVKGRIAGTFYTFASIYLPNTAQHRSLQRILTSLRDFQKGCLYVGGDLNVPLDPRVDTSTRVSGVPQSTIRHIRRTLDSLRLVDSWKSLNPLDHEYTYFSTVHRTYSRLDYLLVSHHCFSDVVDTHIGIRTWSDHAPVTMTIKSPLFRPRTGSWRLNSSLLLDTQFCRDVSIAIQNYFAENVTPGMSRTVVWEAHKAVLRGVIIAKATALKKKRQTNISDLLTRLRPLELEHATTGSTAVYDQILTLRRELQQTLTDDARHMALRAKSFFASRENKPGRLLARILRRRRELAYIPRITTSQTTTTSHPAEILQAFRNFYQTLYSRLVDRSSLMPEGCLRTHLAAKIGARLTAVQAEALGSPIIAGEITTALKSSKNGKTPGPDGFPVEYFKKFAPDLHPHLLATFNAIGEGTELPDSALMAHITVLPKSGRDPLLCDSYRPISLINADVKLLAKILATRLKTHLPSLVGSDQVGFIPGRMARDATTRALDAIRVARNSDTPLLLLSTDAEKAFDKVDWQYLFGTLEEMGVGRGFLTWLQALYRNPTARVRVNGALSHPVSIRRGTRQGCPLSPLLFALSLEPLLQSIRSNPHITGVKGRALTHKVAAYADDLLFFVTEPQTSLVAIHQELTVYGTQAGLTINKRKSEMLDISLTPVQATWVSRSCQFRWCDGRMKYLGIWLTTNPSKLYEYNFLTLLTTIKSDLLQWQTKYISWLGRVNVLKMNILPRILYTMQAIPKVLPPSFFATLQSMFTTFVWPRSRPRVRLDTLSLPKNGGGLALPDIRSYYYATHMARVLDWMQLASEQRWCDLEEKEAGRPLWTLPWLLADLGGLNIDRDSTVHATLRLWHQIRVRFTLSSAPSPLLPLEHNPEFAPGVRETLRQRLTRGARVSALSVLRDGTFASLEGAPGDPPPALLDQFNFQQIQHYLRRVPGSTKLTHSHTFRNTLQPGTEGGACCFYLLIRGVGPVVPSYMGRWERELGEEITQEQWNKILILVHSGSQAMALVETSFKLLTFWYRSPHLLCQIGTSDTTRCWRGCLQTGTYLHVWWSCPHLAPIWRMVRDMIKDKCDFDLPFTAKTFLLLVIDLAAAALKNSLLQSSLYLHLFYFTLQ